MRARTQFLTAHPETRGGFTCWLVGLHTLLAFSLISGVLLANSFSCWELKFWVGQGGGSI